jgi:hypothetical protein
LRYKSCHHEGTPRKAVTQPQTTQQGGSAGTTRAGKIK